MGIMDTIRFLTESPKSEDFGKTRDEWNSAKGKGKSGGKSDQGKPKGK